MPRYSITTDDGTIHEIDGPEGASRQQVISAIQARLAAEDVAKARKDYEDYLEDRTEPEEDDDGGFLDDITPDQVEEFLKGLGGGAAGILESAALGAITPFGEETESALRDKIQGFAAPVQDFFSADRGSEDLIGRKFGEGVGSFLGLAGAAAIPGVGIPAAIALGVGAGAGEASERAREGGATEDERGRAALLGAGVGATEFISPLRIVRALKGGLGVSDATGFIASAKRVAKEAGVEGLQEFAAGVGQNLIEQGIYNPDQGTFEGGAEQFGMGAGVGGFVRTIVELITPRRRGGPSEPTQGELFGPDADLGAAPVTTVSTPTADRRGRTSTLYSPSEGELLGAQTELFDPDEDLGTPPERADDRQLDLFAARAAEPEGEQLSLDIEGAILDRKERELSESLPPEPVEDIDAELRRAVGETPETPMAVAAQEELARREPARIAAEEARIAEEEVTRQQTEAEIAEFESAAVEPEVAVIPEAAPEVMPTQASLPDMGKPYAQTLRDRRRSTTARAPEPRILNEEILDQIGLPPRAAIRKRILGKDFNDPEVRQDLATFAGRPRTSQAAKSGINRLLAAASEEQTDIWGRQPLTAPAEGDVFVAPETEAEPIITPAPETEAASGITQEAQDFLVASEQGMPGSVTNNLRRIAEENNIAVTRTTTPEDIISGLKEKSIVEEPLTASAEGDVEIFGDPITVEEVETATTKPRARVPPAPPADTAAAIKVAGEGIRQAKTAAEVDAERTPAKKPAAKKPAAKAKTETKKPAAKAKTETKKPAAKKATTRKKKSSPATVTTSRKGPAPTPEQLDRIVAITADVRTEVEEEGVRFFTAPTKEADQIIQATKSDIDKIINLLENPPKKTLKKYRTGEARSTTEYRAARTYFNKYENPVDALQVMAHDFASSPKIFRLEDKSLPYSAAEKMLFRETGANTAENALRWTATNLDLNTVKQLQEFIDSQRRSYTNTVSEEAFTKKGDRVTDARKVAAAEAARDELVKQDYATEFIAVPGETLTSAGLLSEADAAVLPDVETDADTLASIDTRLDDEPGLNLRTDAVVGLDIPTHPAIDRLLRADKLKAALRVLAATSPSRRVSQVARTLVQKLGDTKVEVVENLTDEAGKPLQAGLFDPETNTIKINAATGINPHTILHETTHALTSATLDNKSHTVTKQLGKLFNDVKDQLGSVYGSRNLDEFVAEAFGNPEFQQTLAGIIPNANYIVNGKPVNALQRFYRTVVNFVRRILGMQTKPVDSALDQTDQFIEAMLAPAPQSRGAGSLYMKTPSEFMDGLNKVGKSFPKLTPAYRKRWVNSVHNFFSTDNPVKGKGADVLLMTAPLQALTDVARRYGIKSAHKLHTAIQALVGAQSRAETRVDATLRSMSKWLRAETTTDVQRESFNNLVYDSTTEQVDPTKPRDRYKDDAKKLAVWDAMHRRGGDVSIVGKAGIDTYIELRDSYAKQFKELQSVIEGRINSLKDEDGKPLAKEAKEKLKKTVFEKIFEKGRIEPYFPLTRQGDLWIEFNTKVTAADNTVTTEPVYMAFRTAYERKQFRRSLEGNPDVVGEPRMYENIQEASEGARSGAPPTSFINATMELLAGVDADVKDQFTQLFLNALPESSFAKSMVSRKNEGKGTLGFDKDAESAFRFKAFNLASQIERMRHSQNIDDVMGELKAETEAVSQASNEGALGANKTFTELSKRADFAKNPPTDKLASGLNRIAFLGTIGFNASSAIVNMSQIPLMMQPLLGGTYGHGEAYKALANAGNLYRGSGIFGGARKLTTMLGKEVDAPGMTSIDNYYQEVQTTTKDAQGQETTVYSLKIRDDLDLDAAKRKELEDLMPLVQMAADQGQLNRSMFYDNLGLELSGREKGIWDYTNAASAFMFHQVERANRQIAMVSTYQLELNRLREKGGMTDAAMQDAAAQTAIYKSQEMNGGAFLATAPRIAQQRWGRVAMMYKTFGVQMYYTILKTGKAAFSNADPEVRKQAKKQLIGVLGSSMILAGVQGLPMIGAFFAMANLFLDDDEEDAETIVRQFIGEGFYKGGINALTGVDVANRFGLGNLLFRMNPYNQNQSGIEIAAQAVGGPALSVISQVGRGMNDAANGEMRRGIETMLPSAFRNIAKTIRYGQEGAIKSRRGDVIYDDISSGELVSQLFGFAPTGYTLQQEKNMDLKKRSRGAVEKGSKIRRRLYIAIRMGDRDGIQEQLKDIADFNRRHPSLAMSPKNILQSLRTHGKTSATMYHGVTLPPRMRGILKAHADNYWGDTDINLARLID